MNTDYYVSRLAFLQNKMREIDYKIKNEVDLDHEYIARLIKENAILLKEKRAVQICLDDVIHLNLIIDKWFDGQS